jgi:hypothetical protein
MEDRSTVLNKIWADPVWSKVIANAIWANGAVVVAAIVAYFAGWWPSIAAIASKIISLAVASTLVPNWLLVPVCLLALFGIYVFFVMLCPRPTGPNWRDYRQDTFFDIAWRWRYSTYDNSIMNLASFGLSCDTQLLQVHKSSMPYQPYQTIYHCRRCDSRIEISKNVNDVLTDVSLGAV